jgi:NAD(P)H-dependent FMN reductase
MPKIALFVGSVRRDRQGIKVARWIEERLKNRNHIVFFIDPLELNLPLLDRMYKEMVNPSEKLGDLRNKVKDIEGYLSVTPEYNHSTSAAMKNTLDYFFRRILFQTFCYCILFRRWFWWRECSTTSTINICGIRSTIYIFIISNIKSTRCF